MNAVVYSDASYCHKTDIAACGFLVLYNGKMIKHIVYWVSGLKGSIHAEIYALTLGLQFAFLINGVSGISAFTDCKTIVNRRQIKERYRDLDITLRIIKAHQIYFNLHFVKGHATDRYNTMIDRSCNQQLKEYLSKHK